MCACVTVCVCVRACARARVCHGGVVVSACLWGKLNTLITCFGAFYIRSKHLCSAAKGYNKHYHFCMGSSIIYVFLEKQKLINFHQCAFQELNCFFLYGTLQVHYRP